ncbi:hypothetical protein DOT_2205 [Desulfosporosinus sp. OT]|nr:hypothetical protein DOT_2205 [Desulfosporosinus sp. OT]
MITIKLVWASVDLRNPVNKERLQFRELKNRGFWTRLFGK